MKPLTLFRILTFILLPIGSLFGILALMMLGSALLNPAMLFPVFMLVSFVIYIFASLRFLTRVIDLTKPAKSSLRDWIRVNAAVSGFLGFMMLLNTLSIFFMSDITLREALGTILDKQPNVPAMLNLDLFIRIMKMAAWFMLFISVLVLTHIFLNLRLLKTYKWLFQDTPS